MEEARKLKTWLKRMRALGTSGSVLRARLLAELAERSPAEAVALLDGVLGQSRLGGEDAHAVLAGLTQVLQAEELSVWAPLSEQAEREGKVTVLALFTHAQAQREFLGRAAQQQDARLFSQSLGHLKQQARLTQSVEQLERLALNSNPAVMKNLLINPRLTEPMLVRIAARRPARPEPLREIFASPWSTRYPVRRALAFNPYLPPELGAKLLPLLRGTDWREVANDPNLHPLLREQARALLDAG